MSKLVSEGSKKQVDMCRHYNECMHETPLQMIVQAMLENDVFGGVGQAKFVSRAKSDKMRSVGLKNVREIAAIFVFGWLVQAGSC